MKSLHEEWTDQDWEEFEAVMQANSGMTDEEWAAYQAHCDAEIEEMRKEGLIAPEACPHCGAELLEGKGYVGEYVAYCEEHGVIWEDAAMALRIVK